MRCYGQVGVFVSPLGGRPRKRHVRGDERRRSPIQDKKLELEGWESTRAKWSLKMEFVHGSVVAYRKSWELVDTEHPYPKRRNDAPYEKGMIDAWDWLTWTYEETERKRGLSESVSGEDPSTYKAVMTKGAERRREPPILMCILYI